MWNVSENDIELTRGDDFMLGVVAKGRTIANGSQGIMTVKKSKKDTDTVMVKTASFTGNKVVFTFADTDTRELEARKYRYSLKIVDTEGLIYTPVENAIFRINEVIA